MNNRSLKPVQLTSNSIREKAIINNYVFVDSQLKDAGQALEDKQFVLENVNQMMHLIQKYC